MADASKRLLVVLLSHWKQKQTLTKRQNKYLYTLYSLEDTNRGENLFYKLSESTKIIVILMS